MTSHNSPGCRRLICRFHASLYGTSPGLGSLMPVSLVGKTSGLIQSRIKRMDLIVHLHITSLLLTRPQSSISDCTILPATLCLTCHLWATVSEHCVNRSYYLHKMYKRRHIVSIQHVIYYMCRDVCRAGKWDPITSGHHRPLIMFAVNWWAQSCQLVIRSPQAHVNAK